MEYLASGFLPLSKNGNILVLLRNDKNPTWGTVGGGKEDYETNPLDTAKREFIEETKIDKPFRYIKKLFTNKLNGGKNLYINYLGVLDDDFVPELDEENIDYKWISLDDLMRLKNKHFGLNQLLFTKYNDILKVVNSLRKQKK